MTKHLLCAIDLTHKDDAKSLLREADKLAGFYDAALSVVTVLPDYGSSRVGTFFKEGMLREAAKAASDALHDLVREALPDRSESSISSRSLLSTKRSCTRSRNAARFS